MNNNEDNDRWYVDVRGQISVMTTKQILEGLISLQLKVIHRVSKDKQKWRAICNESIFEKDLIRKMMMLSAQSFGQDPDTQKLETPEDTNKLGFDIDTVSGQISSQLEQAKKMQEVSVRLNNVRRVLSEITVNKRVVHKGEIVSNLDELHPEDRDVFVPNEKMHAETKKQFQDTLKKGLVATAVVLIVLFGLSQIVDILLSNANEREKEQVVKEQQKQNINKYANINFDAPIIQKKPSEAIDLSVQVEEEDRFVEMYNAAIDYIKRGDFSGAEDLLIETFKFHKHDRTPSVIALFETALKLDQREMKLKLADPKQKNSLKEPRPDNGFPRVFALQGLLDRMNQDGHPLEAEIVLVKLTKTSLLGGDVTGFARTFIEQYPIETAREGLEPGLSYQRLTWKNLCSWLTDSMEKNRADALLNASLASCMLRGDQLLGAKPYIDYAYKKLPNDASVEVLAGYVQLMTGDVEGAKKIIFKKRDFAAPSIITKKSKEWLCAKHPSDETCAKRAPSAAPVSATKASQPVPAPKRR